MFLSLLLLVSCSDYEKEVPELIRKLESNESSERNAAALRLGRIGAPAANRAVRPLVKLLDDPNVGVQSAAAYALRSIGTPRAKRALEKR